MKSFRILALLSTLFTGFLIFVGGLVRVSGAGLGCPDWPKCFGSWIPPLSVADIPANIDPSHFNITLAWIEYSNRLVGVLLGFIIVAMAIQAIRHFRHVKSILYPSIISALLVAFQGWQGSAVVSSSLESILVSTHLMIALVLASLLIWVTIQGYAYENGGDNSTPRRFSKEMYLWVIGLYVISILQIVLGTVVRTAVERVGGEVASGKILSQAGNIVDVHMIIGLVVTIITVVGALWLIKQVSNPPVLLVRSAQLLVAVSIIQAVLGLALLVMGLVPLAQLYHLWFSSLQVGLALVLFCGLRMADALPERSQHSVGQAILILVVVVVVLGIGGQWVIHQAEQSRGLAHAPTPVETISSLTE